MQRLYQPAFADTHMYRHVCICSDNVSCLHMQTRHVCLHNYAVDMRICSLCHDNIRIHMQSTYANIIAAYADMSTGAYANIITAYAEIKAAYTDLRILTVFVKQLPSQW